MDLIFPEKAPETRVEFLQSLLENFEAIKFHYVQYIAQNIHSIQKIEIQAKFERARQEYGEKWDLFSLNALFEGKSETIDGMSYFWWECLQKHFSSPSDEREGI